MKTLLKHLFLRPALNCSHLIICGIGYTTVIEFFTYSHWLYIVLLTTVWSLGNIATSLSSKYFEVVENEFEKEDSK